jgi:hypothetical protein
MPHPNKRPDPSANPTVLTLLAERPQLDFELEFYSHVLQRIPDFADVLRAQASNLTTKGLLKEGLKVDQKLVQVRPADPTAHYNLACRYALMKQPDLALTTLHKAIELGYRDFRYMVQDRDLDSIRKDPRFRDLLLKYGTR